MGKKSKEDIYICTECPAFGVVNFESRCLLYNKMKAKGLVISCRKNKEDIKKGLEEKLSNGIN